MDFKTFRVNDSRNPKTYHFWSTQDYEILVNKSHLSWDNMWYVEINFLLISLSSSNFSYIAPKNGNANRESNNGGKCSRFKNSFAWKCRIIATYGAYGSRSMLILYLILSLLKYLTLHNINKII